MKLNVFRLRDILISTLLIVFLFPIFIIVSLLVRVKLGSPIYFSQQRPGKKGIPFRLYKFRTMTNDKDELGNLKLDAERLTQFGKFLRSTSMDELPTIINVLKGEMSLIGPRPLLMKYLPLYSSEQMKRHDVLPGITGWAQVNGRNGISWEQKFVLDVWYVDNQSFVLDVKILLLTVIKVIKREGVNALNSATMSEFKGSTTRKYTE